MQIAPSRAPPRPAAPPIAAPPAPAAPRAEAVAAAGAPTPNPALRLDPALGLVVLQFRDAEGAVVATLPTERELAAYRAAGKRADAAARRGVAPSAPAGGQDAAPAPAGSAEAGPGIPASAPAGTARPDPG